MGAPTFYTAADWLVKPGREDDFVAAWGEFVAWSEAEGAQALGGLLLQSESDPRRFLSIGPWASREAAYEWFGRPEIEARSAPLRELVEGFEPRFLELRARRGDVA